MRLPGSSHSPPLRFPFYYGWVILGVCVVSTFFSGATSQLFISTLVKPITDDMGWSRTELAGALTLGVFATAFLGPVLGPLVDRYGPRPVVTIGGVIVTAGFFALGSVQGLWQFYVAYIIGRGVAQAANSGLTATTAVTNWFVRRRGRALGFLGMAFQFSNTILIPVAIFITERWSWRVVYWSLGLGTALFVIAPAAVLLRRRPEDLGLEADGGAPIPQAGGPDAAPMPSADYTAREAMRTSAFWLLAGAQFLMSLIAGSLTFNLAPHFIENGISGGAIALGLSTFALTSGISSTAWGFLAERYSERMLAIVSSLLGAVGVVLFVIAGSDLAAVVLCAYYGLVARGEHSVLNMITARYFGRRSYGAISGAMGPISYISLGMGPLLGSLAFDLFGTYSGFLLSLVICRLLIVLLLAFARQPVRRAAAAASTTV